MKEVSLKFRMVLGVDCRPRLQMWRAISNALTQYEDSYPL